jgi:hypothetical protein
LRTSERRAQQLVALSFFLRAPYIAFEATRALLVEHHAETTVLGIGLSLATLCICPWLARPSIAPSSPGGSTRSSPSASPRWRLPRGAARGEASHAAARRAPRIDTTRCLLRKTSNWCAGWLGRLSAGTTSRCSTRSPPESSRKRPNAGSSRFRAFPDFEIEIADLIAEGDKVVAHFRCSGTHGGQRLGVPATGRRFERVDESNIFEVRGGKLISALGVEDNRTRMRQLGINPAES